MGYMSCMYTNDYHDHEEISQTSGEEMNIIESSLNQEELDKFID